MTVERLADRAAMSPRHFARAFTAETGTTPAKAVERFRLEAARTAVEQSDASFEQIAESAGFRDPGRMRGASLRTLGLPPQALRRSSRARSLWVARQPSARSQSPQAERSIAPA